MPDQTVKVSFDPNANPQFTFDPDRVRMTASGKVIFQRRGESATWTFTGGAVKEDPYKEFSSSVQGQGRVLQMDDKCEHKMDHEYTITVELNGTSHTSPDPVIVNDPGGGGP